MIIYEDHSPFLSFPFLLGYYLGVASNYPGHSFDSPAYFRVEIPGV